MVSLSFFFVLAFGHGQLSKDSLTLHEVLRIVLDKNPVLKQVEGSIEIANSNIGVAKSNQYPKVNLESSFTYTDPVSEVNLPIGDNPLVIPLFPNDNWNVYAGVQYLLYDFGRTKEVINISKIQKSISEEELEAARKKLTYSAVGLFNAILFTQKAIKVQERLISSLQRNLKRVDGLIQNGLATNFDRVNTKVRITTAQNKKTALQNSEDELRHHLAEHMGFNPKTISHKIRIKGNLSLTRLKLENPSPQNSTRSELTIAQHLDSVLTGNQALTSKGNLPFVTIGGTTGYRNGYMPNLDEFTFNYAAFAKITVPLFQGFKTKHELQIARTKVKNHKWRIEEVQNKIKTELEFAEESLQNYYEQFQKNKILIQQAEIAVFQARKKYENQLVTNLDLLDTEVVLAGAELSLFESEYKCVMAQYKVKEAMGVKLWESEIKQ
ncbi:MAG: TolC family protein [Bacteroidota bacterium]